MSEVLRRPAILLLLAAAIGVVLAARSQRAPESMGVAPPLARSHTAASTLDVNHLPRLVDLGADRCVPCKAMAPILASLRTEYAGQFEVQFIDVWKNPGAGEPYRIFGIPTQIFFDAAGRELYRHSGFFSKDEILATWKRLGYDMTPTAAPRG